MGQYDYEFINRPAPKRERRRTPQQDDGPGGCRRALGWFFTLALAGLIAGAIVLIGGYVYLNNQLADAIDEVVSYQGQGPGGTPRFFDRNGNLLFELKTVEKRKWLAYGDFPEPVKQATVAVEDDTFWENPGFDPAAIGAAVLYNVQRESGRPVGASTITQQLVRHIAFDYQERVATSYERKLYEIFLAGVLTRQRSKEDILTMYLNEIYYGNLAYGIEAAAQTYFGKSARDLNLSEAAFLAGLPQAPAQWDPYTNFDGAKQRQEFIIDLMLEDGRINELDAQVAKGYPLTLVPLITTVAEQESEVLLAPHFVLYVQNFLANKYGANALINGGWQVTTSLDLNMQMAAEQVIQEQVAGRRDAHNVTNGAAVVLKPSTNEILAMVGSIDYFNRDIGGQINMTLAPRQPGSTFKPITYAAAMEKGWGPADVIWDVPIELEVGYDDNMTPVNYDGRYHGPLLFRDALANSYNIPPLQLARDVGLPAVIQTARRMGVRSLVETPGYYGLSLTLGGGELPLLEMTHAFSTLANEGKYTNRTPVLKITDSAGNVIYDDQFNRLPPNQVLDSAIAFILTDILDDDNARVAAMGRGSALELPFPAAVKTGTTDDFRDNLTIGYTPSVVIGMWFGNNDATPMRDSSGLRGAAPAWNRLMQAIYSTEVLLEPLLVNGELPAVEFVPPGSVEQVAVCVPRGTGGGRCSSTRQEWMPRSGPLHGIGRIGYRPDVRTNPGAWTVDVLPIPADIAQQIKLQPLDNGFVPPVPIYCVVNSSRTLEGEQTRVFLPIPPFYPDEVRARLWARQNGYQMAPPIACPTSVTSGRSASSGGSSSSSSGGSSSGSGAAAPSGNTSGARSGYHISSPIPGGQVSGATPIRGTVNVADMQYYKLEIGAGRSPSSWTTLGSTHSQAVSNGTLETLQAGGLPPGDYVLRLVVVMNDGNYPAPYSVPITVK